MAPDGNSRLIPYTGLLASVVLWASSFIALKLAFVHYDPMVVIFGRMAVASLCFAPFMPRLVASVRYQRGDWRYLIFMAVCEPCLYFIFEAKALVYTSASQAGMISAVLPLMIAVGAAVWLKEHLSRKTLLGFVMAVAGVCWLSVGAVSTENAPNPLLGNALEVAAMICATGYILTLKHMTSRYSPFFLTAVQAVTGSVFYLPFLFLPSTQLPAAVHPVAAASVVYLGACISFGAYGLYNFGVSRIPASQASVFFNLIPVFTLVMGRVILGDVLTVSQYAAAVLVMAGVLISQDFRPRPGETA